MKTVLMNARQAITRRDPNCAVVGDMSSLSRRSRDIGVRRFRPPFRHSVLECYGCNGEPPARDTTVGTQPR